MKIIFHIFDNELLQIDKIMYIFVTPHMIKQSTNSVFIFKNNHLKLC